MKQLLLILCLIVLCKQTNAQSPNWNWTRSAVGGDRDIATGTSTDTYGNVLVTGYFRSHTLSFGNITLTNSGNDDIFIVKYDANGNVLWAKSAGGSGNDYSYGLTIDAHDNIFITGWFGGSTISFEGTILTQPSFFIVKYSPSGNVIWAKGATSGNNGAGESICVDPHGNAIITGVFSGPSITFGSTTLTSTGSQFDIFVVKFDSNGNVFWAKMAGGTNNDWGMEINSDTNGNILITGYFSSPTITFGSTTLTNAGSGNEDLFIVKYNSNGNVLWAKSAGGTDSENGLSICADSLGNVFATGSFSSPTITFGTTTLINDITISCSDIFIVKYDSGGNVIWAKSAGGKYCDEGRSICMGQNGNVLVTGDFFSPSITFGNDTFTNPTGGGDIFIVDYDIDGNVVWAKNAGGTADDEGLEIKVDAFGNILTAGYFLSSTIIFGNDTLFNRNNSSNWTNIFVTKLGNVTAIEELTQNNTINIYPNPFSTQTTLQLDNSFHDATLTVTNYFGQTVMQINNLNKHTITFNRDNLASGVYFVKLTTDNKTYTGKLVITD
jgi:hypothetical protein